MTADELHKLSREIRILLAVITKIATTSFEQQLAQCDFGVSSLQYGLLRTLHFHPYTLSELSRKFVLDPSTLVPVVDALERKGLIERGKDPNDRRRSPLTLTETGLKLLSRHLPLDENDALARALSAMGNERTELLLSLLRDVMRQMPEGETILSEIVEARLRHADLVEQSRSSSAEDSVI